MLMRILRKSFARRKMRLAIAIVAVLLGASVSTALISVSLDIRENVGKGFRDYGANLLLLPERENISISIGDIDYGTVTEQKYIEESDLYLIKEIGWAANVMGYSPYLYDVVEVNNEKSVISGVWFDDVQKINPWWKIESGNWVMGNNTVLAMIGTSAAEILGLKVGDSFTTVYNDTKTESSESFQVEGIVSTGGSEDWQIFVNLAMVQNLTGKINKVSTVQVSALCTACPVEDIAAEIEEIIPYVEAKTVQQMVNAEMDLLSKIEELMFMVTGVALLASAMGVSTTMTASVVERKKEIGMMKAIGAEDRDIAVLFYTEALMIGLIGGLIGYGIGMVLAQIIGESVFGAGVGFNYIVIPIAIGISVGIALLAGTLPVRKAMKIEPARVLRGD